MSNLERIEPELLTRTAVENAAEDGGLVAETVKTSKSLREQARSWIGGLAGRLSGRTKTYFSKFRKNSLGCLLVVRESDSSQCRRFSSAVSETSKAHVVMSVFTPASENDFSSCLGISRESANLSADISSLLRSQLEIGRASCRERV